MGEAKRKEEERVNAINELVPPLDISGFDEDDLEGKLIQLYTWIYETEEKRSSRRRRANRTQQKPPHSDPDSKPPALGQTRNLLWTTKKTRISPNSSRERRAIGQTLLPRSRRLSRFSRPTPLTPNIACSKTEKTERKYESRISKLFFLVAHLEAVNWSDKKKGRINQ